MINFNTPSSFSIQLKFISIALFMIQICAKQLYIIFMSRLLVVTMTEMYRNNHAVSYKLHKQTVNTINCNDYILWLNL